MEQRHILSDRRPPGSGLTRDFILGRFGGQRAVGVRSSQGLGLRGDHSLTPGAVLPDRVLTPAAVLVPIVEQSAAPTVLLTQRTAHLSDHAGQIAFPGGRIEPEDRDAVAAALRETEEEVGLPASHIEVIGRLDTYVTGTGFEVTPIVALVRAPYPSRPDPFEVAEIFEVPLSFIIDPTNHQRSTREWKGMTRHFFVLPYENRYIWGATAGMLVNLAEILGEKPA
jgi:8-oxo-dGTP pyrophosphatase MutT (NUDIX family)